MGLLRMDRETRKDLVRVRKKTESDYLHKKIDNDPRRTAQFLNEGNIEPLVYLNEFIERFDDKEFYRTFERIESGSYDTKEVAKALHSLTTHIYIEADENDVPESVFEYLYGELEKVRQNEYETAWNSIQRIIP